MKYSNILACLINLLIICGCHPIPETIEPISQIPLRASYLKWLYDELNDLTQITLTSGKKLFIKGRFEVSPTLWGNNSLL